MKRFVLYTAVAMFVLLLCPLASNAQAGYCGNWSPGANPLVACSATFTITVPIPRAAPADTLYIHLYNPNAAVTGTYTWATYGTGIPVADGCGNQWPALGPTLCNPIPNTVQPKETVEMVFPQGPLPYTVEISILFPLPCVGGTLPMLAEAWWVNPTGLIVTQELLVRNDCR